MNRRLLAASILAAITAVGHIFGGGADVVSPLLASDMAAEPRIILYSTWHMASIALVFSAIALFVAGLPRHAQSSRSLVIFISVLWLGFAAAFVVVALTESERGWLFKLPQWMVLAPVGLLGLWGSRTMTRTTSSPS